MEIFGGQKVQLKSKWRSDLNKQLKRYKAKEKRAFLKSRKLWRAEEKEKWQWGRCSQYHSTAFLLVLVAALPGAAEKWLHALTPTVKVYKIQQRELNLSYQKLSQVYATGVMSTQAGKDNSCAPHPAQPQGDAPWEQRNVLILRQ